MKFAGTRRPCSSAAGGNLVVSVVRLEEDAASNGARPAKTVKWAGATPRHLVRRPVVVIVDHGA